MANSIDEGVRELRTLAVMFTDMAGSTEFAEKHGASAAYEKRQQHNRLLPPLVDAHRGTLVEIVGDALLVIFNRTDDAARCAIAMQRRLAEYNATTPDLEDLEIHIRAGIHHGKAIVVCERGNVEVAGRAVNVAARVEAAGGKATDQILLSEAALAQLLCDPTFVTEPIGVVEAKGIGRLALHRLLWREKEIQKANERPVSLAAEAAESLGHQAENADSARTIHCLFVDPSTQRGYVVPASVQVRASQPPGIYAGTACDRVMEAAARRAVQAAFGVLGWVGFENARLDQHTITWWLDGDPSRYEGPSLGLAIALATVAAYTGIEIDPGIAVTGSISGELVVPVVGIGSKWSALRASGRFHTLVLPTDNVADLPAKARGDPHLCILDVPDVEAAVVDVFGPALGLALHRFTQAVGGAAPATGAEIDVQLWIQPAARRALTRHMGIRPSEDVHTWNIGDRVRACALSNAHCHLALVNIGPTGNVTILIPNSHHPDTTVRAGQVVTFPAASDRFDFELLGPPGRERLIAIASDRPLQLTPQDFDQSGQLICARPTTRNIGIVVKDIAAGTLGRCEIEFYVSAKDTSQAAATTRSCTFPNSAEFVPEFQSLDLG